MTEPYENKWPEGRMCITEAAFTKQQLEQTRIELDRVSKWLDTIRYILERGERTGIRFQLDLDASDQKAILSERFLVLLKE